ncbi:MAG: 5-(carboxyamino)imidazole ribonucleotide synthase [Rickettsiales bacterium]|nr:5-(carboxyamino)imidazole ribonucleotide synthase [Pseudomonadota bacterium]MDA0966823.1 5-(carboxyamino)imidazole ribonucleotide synthase [Pseudomonadota bacterium]MDG4543497.1 5-(carboxyamino)imidazole ribonucleotide synthase [Rickettsiales bacterium]MDG4546109.1 5-(carboxyamino)imidazole ribonucleotide synthase [Rickettsiales bacterium]MDG4547582.1 5-(carboxyamino)imidazole ribonucleotide synthase [Rickettsiales bacterium]
MKVIKPGATIGIFGGGQLGRMSALAAANLGYKVHIYTNKDDSPASHFATKTIIADYEDKEALLDFAKNVDVITFEFENIPHKSIQLLEEISPVNPRWQVLHITKNRLREKRFINSIGIATARFEEVVGSESLKNAFNTIGTDCILKTVEDGYDGKGQYKINGSTDFKKVWNESGMKVGVLEGKVDFTKEISVIVARTYDGQTVPYPPVENIHKDGILDTTISPAQISAELAFDAKEIATKIAQNIELVGLLAVEMFVTKNNEIIINELAPRPHNSGHCTIDASITNQFEQFIRAVCGLPLGNPDYHSKSVMKNLIGDEINLWKDYVKDPNAKLHLYGKKVIKEGRKMGHVTIIQDN